MTRDDMAKGMALLSTAFNRALTDELVEIYHGVIGPKLDAARWERAVRRALDSETFFPPPAVLLRYGLAEGSPQARAVEAYDRILAEFEGGRPMGPREVLQLLGRAAMEAFIAAGGHRAFTWCDPDDEPFRRKAFVEAWIDVIEQEPALALPEGARGGLLR
jgi:hypothetical protein